uniref:Uncharacterized protein LOC105124380 isoform X2 n=1 Tax=Rhizophora mucronata TaxID=61149 RepID=A0A2P2KQ07_RHIMU
MSRQKWPPRSGQSSVTYRQNRVDGARPFLADFDHEKHGPSISSNKEESSKNFEPRAPKILSTPELISAVGQIWDLVNPPAVFKTKAKLNQNDCGCHKIGNPCGEEVVGIHTLKSASENYSIDARTFSLTLPALQPRLELLKISQKMSTFELYGENYICPLFKQFSKEGTNFPKESWKGNGLASIGISRELKNTCRWVRERIPSGSQYLSSEFEIVNISNNNCTPEVITSDASNCNSGFAAQPANAGNSSKSKEALLGNTTHLATMTAGISSLCSDYFLGALQENGVNNSISPASSSSLCVDSHIEYLAPCMSTCERFQHEANDYKVSKIARVQPQETVSQDRNRLEFHSSASERPYHALAKQEHAFAGALAGVFVSLCLHPVDTLKTVIQSCHVEQRSNFSIGKSIVSERGVTGLYRGIASNIASSAPISAIYTFTYESVKGSLLPLLPKDYHFFSHCIAGGCASIATSTVFTPSERVKQQMQIGSRYHNCWKALIGIITKGGLPSLYAGWGAVLCRNVPHSIIKFYTYESLKPLILSPQSSTAAPNAIQTVCPFSFSLLPCLMFYLLS